MRWGVGGKEELQGRVWMGEDGGKGMFMSGSDDLDFLEMVVHVQCAWRKVLVNVTMLCYGCKRRWHVDNCMSQRLHMFASSSFTTIWSLSARQVVTRTDMVQNIYMKV